MMSYSSTFFVARFCCALAIRGLMSIVMGLESSGMPFSDDFHDFTTQGFLLRVEAEQLTRGLACSVALLCQPDNLQTRHLFLLTYEAARSLNVVNEE